MAEAAFEHSSDFKASVLSTLLDSFSELNSFRCNKDDKENEKEEETHLEALVKVSEWCGEH